MTEPRLQDFPSLVVFGERLMEAATAETMASAVPVPAPDRAPAATPTVRPRRRRRRSTAVALAAAGSLLVACGSAAATLLVLNGSAIPPFARADDAATVRPLPGTAAVVSVRAADPLAGAPPWTLRLSKGPGATACVAVGQVDQGRFGLLGLDGVFRTLPVRGADSCGTPPTQAAPILGVRTFSAPDPADQRSVLYGLGGPELRAVTVRVTGQAARTLPVSPAGAFVTAYPGSLDAARPTLRLRYAGGHAVTRTLGGTPHDARVLGYGSFIGWRTQTYPAGALRCVRIVPAHQLSPAAIGPSACAPPDRFSFDTAALASGDHGPGKGAFQGYRFRVGGTFAWGQVPAGTRATLLLPPPVARLDPRLSPDGRVPVDPAPDGTFAFVLPRLPANRDQTGTLRMEAVGPDGVPHVYRTTTGLTFRGSTR